MEVNIVKLVIKDNMVLYCAHMSLIGEERQSYARQSNLTKNTADGVGDELLPRMS